MSALKQIDGKHMIIVSNSLTAKTDEGCLKVANSLVKRLKTDSRADAFVVTYERESALSDKHINVNKFMLSKELRAIIKERKEKVFYIPFPAKPIATAIRIFSLSRYAKYGFEAAMVMNSDFRGISKILMKMSKVKVDVFSKESADRYQSIVGEKRIRYMKAGVDTEKFVPVSVERKAELKSKYGLDESKPVVLHVGHLNAGRNIDKLMNIDKNYQVVLVVSTLTQSEQDIQLKENLLSCGNIKIIEDYVPDIEQIYQMSDVYFFPVVEEGHCIDIPLSCMEAAACNLPVVCTSYGELSELVGNSGFYCLKSFEKDALNLKIEQALKNTDPQSRSSAELYDWKNAIENLLSM